MNLTYEKIHLVMSFGVILRYKLIKKPMWFITAAYRNIFGFKLFGKDCYLQKMY